MYHVSSATMLLDVLTMIEIYTDACIYKGVGGVGIYCSTNEVKSVKSQKNYPKMTIQALELEAIHRALSMAGTLSNVAVFTDSSYAFDSIVTNGHCNNQRDWCITKNKYMHCHELLKMCYTTLLRYKSRNKNITLCYVKGHSGVPGNIKADKLAGIAAGKIIMFDNIDHSALTGNEVAPVTIKDTFITSGSISSGSKTEVTVPMSLGSDSENFFGPGERNSFTRGYDDEYDLGGPITEVKGNRSSTPLSRSGHIDNDAHAGAPNVSEPRPYSRTQRHPNTAVKNEREPDDQHIPDTVIPRVMRTKARYPGDNTNSTPNLVSPEFTDICELYLACVQCAQMIVVKYPKGHPIASPEELNITTDLSYAVTWCKTCIMLHVSPKSVNIAAESIKYKDCFDDMHISTKMMNGCKPHGVAEHICEARVNILSTVGYVEFVPITTINRLCNRGTVSQTVSVGDRELRTFLENGFL